MIIRAILFFSWSVKSISSKSGIEVISSLVISSLLSIFKEKITGKVFELNELISLLDCKFSESSGDLSNEIKREILKKAAIYKAQIDDKKNSQYKDYKVPKNFGKISEKNK